MKTNTCCFIGHRNIQKTEELICQLDSIIEDLITKQNVDTFFFGSKSSFNTLCYEQLTKYKEKHPHIKRIYIRAEFAEINKSYEDYLLALYEDTYYPKTLAGAGKAIYLERNYIMIDKSDICVIYCQEDYKPKKRKSGAKLAFDYAQRKNKTIIHLP